MVAFGATVILAEEHFGAAPALAVHTLTPVMLLTEAALQAAPGLTVQRLGAAMLLHQTAVGATVLHLRTALLPVVARIRTVTAPEALTTAPFVAVRVAATALAKTRIPARTVEVDAVHAAAFAAFVDGWVDYHLGAVGGQGAGGVRRLDYRGRGGDRLLHRDWGGR